MRIKHTVIEGVEDDLAITATESGAALSANGVEVHVGRDDSPEERFCAALNAAKVVYGTDRRGEPNATNSMIHDVLREIERVAGC